MEKYIASVHEEKMCDLNQHIATVQKGKKPFKCEKFVKSLKVGSLNIGRGLFKKEELLLNTINEQRFDIFSVSECDLEDFDESKPFSIKGFRTYFPLQRPGTSFKRLLCFVSERIEVKQRSDLMSNLISTLWLEIKGAKQKVLICAIYREFSNLSSKGQMVIDQQIDRW